VRKMYMQVYLVGVRGGGEERGAGREFRIGSRVSLMGLQAGLICRWGEGFVNRVLVIHAVAHSLGGFNTLVSGALI
jgi:hypothetical protein